MPARMAENNKLPWTLEMMCACGPPLGPKIPFCAFFSSQKGPKKLFSNITADIYNIGEPISIEIHLSSDKLCVCKYLLLVAFFSKKIFLLFFFGRIVGHKMQLRGIISVFEYFTVEIYRYFIRHRSLKLATCGANSLLIMRGNLSQSGTSSSAILCHFIMITPHAAVSSVNCGKLFGVKNHHQAHHETGSQLWFGRKRQLADVLITVVFRKKKDGFYCISHFFLVCQQSNRAQDLPKVPLLFNVSCPCVTHFLFVCLRNHWIIYKRTATRIHMQDIYLSFIYIYFLTFNVQSSLNLHLLNSLKSLLLLWLLCERTHQ